MNNKLKISSLTQEILIINIFKKKESIDKNPKRFFVIDLKYERKDIKSNGLINLHKFYDAFQDIILIQFYALRFTIKE